MRSMFRQLESSISAMARTLLPNIALLVLSALDYAAQCQGREQHQETISPRLMIRRDAITYQNCVINNFTNYPNHTVPILPSLVANYHPREFTVPLDYKIITGFESTPQCIRPLPAIPKRSDNGWPDVPGIPIAVQWSWQTPRVCRRY